MAGLERVLRDWPALVLFLASLAWLLAGWLHVRVTYRFRLDAAGLRAGVTVRLPGGLVVRRRWRAAEQQGEPVAAGMPLRARLGRQAGSGGAMALILRRARVVGLEWRTRLGLGDAALTAWAAGVVWTVKGVAVAGLNSRYGRLSRPPRLVVEPVFDRWALDSRCACIFDVTVRDIMVAAPAAAGLMLRSRRPAARSRGEGTRGAAPHREPDAHRDGEHPRDGRREHRDRRPRRDQGRDGDRAHLAG